jgi:hypothetical protein
MSTRKVLRSTLLAVAIGAVLTPLTASSDHAWSNYHWARSSNPFSLRLGDNVSGVWDSSLQLASSDWSVSDVLDTSVVAGASSVRRCRASTGRIEVCNSTYGRNGWLGIASISVSGSHITSASVRVNDTYFNTAQYNTSAWRNLVMCQEVGHTFGLDHQDENNTNPNLGTCMDYTNSPASNQHPNAHDYEELELIYGHLDSAARAASAEPAPPAMRQLDLAGPGQWGRVIRRYPNGSPKLYELDFGRGNRILTHVFWAPHLTVSQDGVVAESEQDR